MSRSKPASVAEASREQRIVSLTERLRFKVEQACRKLVERAVDGPEENEFGAIIYEFRDGGLDLAKEVQQAA